MKSIASFYQEVSKALRCISHWLVSLLTTLPYTSSFHSISNSGKWACSSQIGALPPWPEVHLSCCKGMSVCVRPGLHLHLVEWTRHSMDFSNCGCIQRTSIWVPGGAISHFGLFRIRMLFGKNGYDKVRRFYFLDTFSFCIFQII